MACGLQLRETPLLLFSSIADKIWGVESGDWQTAFTVAGLILTAGTCKYQNIAQYPSFLILFLTFQLLLSL